MGFPGQLRQIMVFSVLALATGCSQPGFRSAERERPFRQGDAPDSSQAVEPKAPAREGAALITTSRLPFSSHELPAGTLFTVHLEKSIYARPGAATFTATLDETVVGDGSAVVPRGASVRGSVEAGQPLTGTGEDGYFRLTLETVTIDGTDVPLSTSSLFVRGRRKPSQSSPSHSAGYVSGKEPPTTYLRKGRNLTFRLSAPVSIQVPSAGSEHLSLLEHR